MLVKVYAGCIARKTRKSEEKICHVSTTERARRYDLKVIVTTTITFKSDRDSQRRPVVLSLTRKCIMVKVGEAQTGEK